MDKTKSPLCGRRKRVPHSPRRVPPPALTGSSPCAGLCPPGRGRSRDDANAGGARHIWGAAAAARSPPCAATAGSSPAPGRAAAAEAARRCEWQSPGLPRRRACSGANAPAALCRPAAAASPATPLLLSLLYPLLYLSCQRGQLGGGGGRTPSKDGSCSGNSPLEGGAQGTGVPGAAPAAPPGRARASRRPESPWRLLAERVTASSTGRANRRLQLRAEERCFLCGLVLFWVLPPLPPPLVWHLQASCAKACLHHNRGKTPDDFFFLPPILNQHVRNAITASITFKYINLIKH